MSGIGGEVTELEEVRSMVKENRDETREEKKWKRDREENRENEKERFR